MDAFLLVCLVCDSYYFTCIIILGRLPIYRNEIHPHNLINWKGRYIDVLWLGLTALLIIYTEGSVMERRLEDFTWSVIWTFVERSCPGVPVNVTKLLIQSSQGIPYSPALWNITVYRIWNRLTGKCKSTNPEFNPTSGRLKYNWGRHATQLYRQLKLSHDTGWSR